MNFFLMFWWRKTENCNQWIEDVENGSGWVRGQKIDLCQYATVCICIVSMLLWSQWEEQRNHFENTNNSHIIKIGIQTGLYQMACSIFWNFSDEIGVFNLKTVCAHSFFLFFDLNLTIAHAIDEITPYLESQDVGITKWKSAGEINLKVCYVKINTKYKKMRQQKQE